MKGIGRPWQPIYTLLKGLEVYDPLHYKLPPPKKNPKKHIIWIYHLQFIAVQFSIDMNTPILKTTFPTYMYSIRIFNIKSFLPAHYQLNKVFMEQKVLLRTDYWLLKNAVMGLSWADL